MIGIRILIQLFLLMIEKRCSERDRSPTENDRPIDAEDPIPVVG